MYQEIKVYDADTLSNFKWWNQVFTCRGTACDEAWAQRRNRNVRETRILYKGEAPQGGETLHRWVGKSNSGLQSGLLSTAWYLTAEEAEEERDRLGLGNGCPQKGTLNLESIDPLPQQFQIQFELDGKGRPFTRINAHPERDGKTLKGKIFFPDRSFVGADSGAATVSISKEFDTYGFLSGEMVKFGMPDMNRFLDWAWENRTDIQEVLFINHPGRGEYLAVEQGGCANRIIDILDFEGNPLICTSCMLEAEEDSKKYPVRRKSLDEIFLEAAWGMEVNMDVLDAMFTRSRLFESGRAAADWERSLKFRGDLVDCAVRDGILSQYVSPSLHIEVMTLNRQNISLFGNYQYSDVEEIAKVVAKVNQEADESGKAKVKKGLLLPF